MAFEPFRLVELEESFCHSVYDCGKRSTSGCWQACTYATDAEPHAPIDFRAMLPEVLPYLIVLTVDVFLRSMRHDREGRAYRDHEREVVEHVFQELGARHILR